MKFPKIAPNIFTQGNLGWGKRKVDKVLSMFARALVGQ